MAIGENDILKCNCGWSGQRKNLVSVSRFNGYDKKGESIWVEDYDACPICKTELY